MYFFTGGVYKLKMNIYRKRQLGALAVLCLLIFSLVFMVRCVAGSKKQDNSKVAEESSGKEDGQLVPNVDIPELNDMIEKEKNIDHNFVEYSDLDFVNVEFEPDDISLIDKKYLDDVVIIGDSISKGYSVYGRMEDNNVLAVGSIGVRNILDTQFDYQGYSLALTDILGRKKPKYIFISLGMNDINLRTEEEFTGDFKNLIAEIQKATPGSVVMITAITPVSRQTTFTTNEKIDTYNESLRKMVFEYNSDKIFYVNAARYLKGDDNYLISDFSSGDGIHLAAQAYDYLLTYMLSMLEWI